MYRFVLLAASVIGVCYAQAVAQAASKICPKRNTYLESDGHCDSYIECREYVPVDKLCPDGLHYNPQANWPQYPCGYPSDVSCVGRGPSRPANPTAECPQQYGFFPSPNAGKNECGKYRLCAEGKALDMYCPFGLAFNPETARCDYPELVPSCNSDEYLGFKCPPGKIDESGNPIVTNHKYGNDCYYFFSCQSGNARILSCDPGFAFNAVTGHCEDADHVECSAAAVATPN